MASWQKTKIDDMRIYLNFQHFQTCAVLYSMMEMLGTYNTKFDVIILRLNR